jgi:hypothetical protein
MGEILVFRSSAPVIYIDGADRSWYLNVRPCPVGMPTLLHFDSYSKALSRAVEFQNAHGWTIEILHADEQGGAA